MGVNMGRLGRTYTRADYTTGTAQNAPLAFRRFDRSLSEEEAIAIRHKITAGIIGVICVLGFVGWVLAFR